MSGCAPFERTQISAASTCAQVVLGADADVLDMPDAMGDTALHVAASTANTAVLQHLLSLKPESINAQNLDGRCVCGRVGCGTAG